MALGAFNHLALTVTDMARAEKYYDRLLGFLGYQQAEKSDEFILWAGQHGGITLSPANPDSPNKTHDRYSPGLHHFAFNADSREDVDPPLDSRGCLEKGEDVSLRGAVGDEAISFPATDCFASLAMTCTTTFQIPSRLYTQPHCLRSRPLCPHRRAPLSLECRSRQSSTVMAQRSWSRQRPAILR